MTNVHKIPGWAWQTYTLIISIICLPGPPWYFVMLPQTYVTGGIYIFKSKSQLIVPVSWEYNGMNRAIQNVFIHFLPAAILMPYLQY